MGVFAGFFDFIPLVCTCLEGTSCAHLGSNQGPKDYESSTLTNWAIGAANRSLRCKFNYLKQLLKYHNDNKSKNKQLTDNQTIVDNSQTNSGINRNL